MINDGRHTICDESVYFEDGKIIRAKTKDRNGSEIPASVYRACKDGWNKTVPLTVDAFRSGCRRGTIAVM